MNKTIKRKWVEALRSKKYDQGKGKLHNSLNNTYCCLGVLCEVMGVKKIGDKYNGNSYELDNDLLKKCGLRQDTMGTLMTKNDSGESFESIANHIESRIKED